MRDPGSRPKRFNSRVHTGASFRSSAGWGESSVSFMPPGSWHTGSSFAPTTIASPPRQSFHRSSRSWSADENTSPWRAYALLIDADASAFAFAIEKIVRGHGQGAMSEELAQEVRDRLDALGGAGSDLTYASGYGTLGLLQLWLGRTSDALEYGTQAFEHARRAEDRDFTAKARRIIGMAKWHGPTPWGEVMEHAAVMEALVL